MVRDHEVAGSSPVAPTFFYPKSPCLASIFLYICDWPPVLLGAKASEEEVMKKNVSSILLVLAGLLSLAYVVKAEEDWKLIQPGNANIPKSGVIASAEKLGLFVPKSFEGRKADENRMNVGFEFKNLIRYVHSDSKVELRGRASHMDFKYKRDAIDIQVFRSKKGIPNTSSCMDCHGESLPQTTAIIGYEKTKYDNEPYYEGSYKHNINGADSSYFTFEVNHWLQRNLMLKLGGRWGEIKQGNYKWNAHSVALGLGGNIKHRLTWSGDLIIGKAEDFPTRKSLVGKLAYRILGGLKLRLEAGYNIDGYTMVGSDMSDMGVALAESVRKYDKAIDTWLPPLFKKLRDDKFGYYNACLEYEYLFK